MPILGGGRARANVKHTHCHQISLNTEHGFFRGSFTSDATTLLLHSSLLLDLGNRLGDCCLVANEFHSTDWLQIRERKHVFEWNTSWKVNLHNLLGCKA